MRICSLSLSTRIFALAAILPTLALGQTNTPAPAPASPATRESEPDHGLAAANAISALLRQNQADQALAAAQSETKKHPDGALAWYALGNVYLSTHHPKDALAPLEKSNSLHPHIGPTLLDLGSCYAELGRFDEAIDAFSGSVDQMPDYLPAWLGLYHALGSKKDLLAADDKLQDLLKAHPKSAPGWFVLSQLETYEQLPASTMDSLQKAVSLNPNFAEAWNYLGIAYGKTQDVDKAIACFARATAAKPGYDEALNNLGYSYLVKNRPDLAAETLKQAVTANPKNARAMYNLVTAYARQQKWELARSACQQLAQLDPQHAAELNAHIPPAGATPAAASVEASNPAPPPQATPSTAVVSEATPPAVPAPAESAATTNASVAAPTQAVSTSVSAPPAAPDQSPPAATPETPVVTPASTPPPAPAPAPTPIPALASTSPAQVTAQMPTAPTPDVAPSPTSTLKNGAVTYDTGPPAAWVKPIDADTVPAPASSEVEGGIDYLLIDNQQLVDPAASFSHYTLRLTNQEGLQNGSDIRAEFDPSYQTLTLHWLKVKRDGVWQDRLASENFQVLRREENLDSQMLDGRYSVICHLQDVRVGDLVDFAYTVKGANPVFGGKYIHSFLTTFVRPVHLFSNQLTTAPYRLVFVKSFGGAMEPVHTQNPDQSEVITWKKEEVPATQLEPRTSEWYDAFGWVQATEFIGWKDVVDWGLSTFSLDEKPDQPLADKIDEIAKAHTSVEDRALAVIDFVQNDIRYLGIEMGANSYKPTPASQVFEHRFGDCKDKTQLAVVMLRALGIEAYPALVNTTRGKETEQLLPSPLAFDHAIVQLVVDRVTYWIDVTRTGQRGRLGEHFVDDFKQALVLKPGNDGLATMKVSPDSLPQIAVEEAFTVKSMTDPVICLIHTIFKGRSAEAVRSSFTMSSRDEMEKAYLNFYARDYAKIKVEKPLRSQDYPNENRFEIWQNYSIADLWTRDSPTSQWKAGFMPTSIIDAIGSPTSAQRTTPFRIDYPAEVTDDMQIHMFHEWPLEAQPLDVETPNFTFSEKPVVAGDVIRFKYHYQALSPDVLPANIGDYDEQIGKIRDRLGCTLTYLPGADLDAKGNYRPNWIAFALFGLVFVVCIGVAIQISFIRKRRSRSSGYGFRLHDGIGGWLIALIIGLVVNIFVNGKTIWFTYDIACNLTKWNILTMPSSPRYNALWAPIMLYEGSFSIILVVASILALVLMFKKRYTFPKVMIAILAMNLIYHVGDHFMASQIPAIIKKEDAAVVMGNLLRIFISCAIWIPYMVVSRRVKETFRK